MNNTIAYIIALAILTPVVIIGAVIALNNTDQEPITQQPIKVQNQRVQTIALQEPEVAGITLASQPITQHQYPRVAPIQEQVKVQQPVKSVKQAEPQTKEVITGTQTLDVYERYYGVKAQKDGRFWVFKVGNKWYYHYQIDRDDKNIRIHEGTPDVEYYREDGTKKQTDRFFRDMLADRIYWHADGKTKKTHERYSRGELSSIKHYNADGTEVQTHTPTFSELSSRCPLALIPLGHRQVSPLPSSFLPGVGQMATWLYRK